MDYKDSNMDYVVAALTDEAIVKFITHHKTHQVPRLTQLEDYYEGENKKIQEKSRKYKHLSNHQPSHNYAKYVSDFMTSYILGKPIAVTHTEASITTKLSAIHNNMDFDSLNAEIELDCSIFGRAYEALYRTDDDKSAKIDVKNTFCIYENTVEGKKLAGVRYRLDADNTTVEVYTEGLYRRCQMAGPTLEDTQPAEPRYYDGIPIIEYKNNRYRLGDFEGVLTLIDLYDSAQADTANYMSDLNDALLVIKGNVSIDEEEAQTSMRDHNLLLLETPVDEFGHAQTAEAGYIYKQYDVTGVEKYKDRIQNDIHKFTYTPNLNDSNFAGQTQSGVAMSYKLFGLEQIRAIKERYLKKGLRERYRLFGSIGARINTTNSIDPSGLSITFTPNLPKSLAEELKNFNDAMELPIRTRLTLIPSIVESTKIEALAKEIEDVELLEDTGGSLSEGFGQAGLTDGQEP